jgi:hypothetical protein
MSSKVCTLCLEVKDEEYFSGYLYRKRGDKRSFYRRPECKKCHSALVGQRHQERNLERFPEKYRQCENEDCNYVWHIKRGTEICPRCEFRLS